MKRIGLVLALLLSAPTGLAQQGTDGAWVMSIPGAYSGRHIYKVRILAIDGEARPDSIRHALKAGTRTISVELMLDVHWDPDLLGSERPPAVKDIELEIEAGRSYQLAARIDVEAPVEAQLDQSFWEVFVFRKD